MASSLVYLSISLRKKKKKKKDLLNVISRAHVHEDLSGVLQFARDI
jgi:hypothetical protein